MSKFKPYLYIAPVAILLITIIGMGIFTCICQSLGYFPQIGMTDITLSYYKELLSDKQFVESIYISLRTALISSIISVLVGVILAYFISKEKFSKFRYFLINLPIIVPHIVVILLTFAIFSKSGIISRILYNLDLISDSNQFISLVNDKYGIGIILVYIYKGIPFIALTTYNILKSLDKNLEDVARNLGANNVQAFKFIILPQIIPSIISSFIIIFAFSFGSFEVPYLIGATSPKALPVNAYLYYIGSDLTKRPISMAMNTVLAGISFILLIIYDTIFKKIYKYKL
ncbi:ABC transporter permease [Paraclostridium sordellii]|uniref:Polyamine transport system, permease protein n=1 Tax=Paraclostridium sordellii TaxID=1505 RepID=A0ABM9RN07_PARSO|nr:ABC transporter permease subunit [Paeniclostridium sordellii]AUN14146.1 spermidine/putrescine ABC transporter permease [Paeniclostridium sordellii]MDU2148285.1 ABC transporter permease subunit [Paeniclostridium sordellii]MDU4414336.1 ABC transporter permease subunit [Paeniclostridium sordellii]MRZ29613.1 ABC transporter permease subunit [Paeniclostridium sordellii]MVO74270.1 ABC transporter permease subunit [Paeniclostridium sordellii]